MIQLLSLAFLLFTQSAAFKVSGTVASAMPANGTRIIRVALRGATPADTLAVLVDDDGTFEISNVKPGEYTALAYSSTAFSAPVPVTVGSADVSGLAIRLAAPKEVRGRVTVQGNLPSTVPLPRVGLSLIALPGLPTSSAGVPVTMQPDGTFTVLLPIGERQLNVVANTIPPGYKVGAFTYGTTDVLKNPIQVAAADTSELKLTLDATGITPVTVSGRVNGLLTTQGVRVVMTNAAFGSVESSVTPDGSFVFPKVLPGNYTARLSLSGLSAARAVTVGTRDVADIVINYPRNFVVTGHIVVDGAAVGATAPEVTLEAKDVAGAAAAAVSRVANTEVIMMNLKDGQYNVSLRGVPAGFQLKSLTYGTTDLQKAPLKIDGPVTWEIIVRLTQAR